MLEGKLEEEIESVIKHYICEDELNEFWKQERMRMLCGIGTVERGLNGIRDSYSMAFKAMNVGSMLYRDRLIYRYKELQLFCELEKFLRSSETDMLTDVLKPIRNPELLETLYMYFECGNSTELTAQKLYIHKNTIKYRLNRIQELTGMDLKKPDDNFRFYLAFLANKLNSEK